jgi:hypothetical protein
MAGIGLLPQGLRDRLPGEAAAQARMVRALLDSIEACGYDRVSPPLAEYEEGLAARLKSSPTDLARFVDPLSQRTLAIRPDITPQIARIELADAAAVYKLYAIVDETSLPPGDGTRACTDFLRQCLPPFDAAVARPEPVADAGGGPA